jgi:ribosome-binding factor A
VSKIRQRRTAEQIRTIFSELVLREMRDPRLQDLTFTEVKLDRELQYADVYVNALGDDAREKEVMDALEGAKGYLRRELASRLHARTVPQLHFHWDPTLAHAEQIGQLLDGLEIPPPTANSEES